MVYGYARVSSKDQKLDRQVIELENFGISINNIFCDKQSGKDFDRTQYQKMKTLLKEGDLLVIKSIDRLGRNYEMIIAEWSEITKSKNCDIVVLDMNLLDTRSNEKNLIGRFISDVVLQILSFVAENERTHIKIRQAEGIKIAKQKGVVFGRPSVTLPNNFKEVVEKYRKKQISFKQALSYTKMTKASFYKYIKKLNSNIN